MQKIQKAFSEPTGLDEAEIVELGKNIEAIFGPRAVYLFGSAVEGAFYEDSDFDILVVFDTEAEARLSWKLIPKLRRLSKRSIDFVSMSQQEFDEKKELGGIAMVAYQTGRQLL